MEAIEYLLIERACERLCIDYAHRADARADSFADLFTQDANLVLVGEEANGQAEILALIRRRKAEGLLTRHLCCNIAVEVVSPNAATGTVDATYFVGRPVDGVAIKRTLTPFAIGTYSDQYCLTPDGWRIAHRSYRTVFLRAEPTS